MEKKLGEVKIGEVILTRSGHFLVNRKGMSGEVTKGRKVSVRPENVRVTVENPTGHLLWGSYLSLVTVNEQGACGDKLDAVFTEVKDGQIIGRAGGSERA